MVFVMASLVMARDFNLYSLVQGTKTLGGGGGGGGRDSNSDICGPDMACPDFFLACPDHCVWMQAAYLREDEVGRSWVATWALGPNLVRYPIETPPSVAVTHGHRLSSQIRVGWFGLQLGTKLLVHTR